MATKSKTAPLSKVDYKLLTPEKIKSIQKKAEDVVAAEQLLATEEEFLSRAIDQERAKHDPKFAEVPVTIDLPPFASYLMIDGKFYYHGETVNVTAVQLASIREQMHSMWTHERISGNPNMNHYVPVVKQGEVSGSSIARV